MIPSSTHWPYPRWIAHRGAGTLAPENTLAAFRLGAAHGFGMAECDVKLSADGVPFLLHDATLQRTTDGRGTAGRLAWTELSRLDAGGWLSPAFAGEPLPSLADIAGFCRDAGFHLNIEIKPTPGTARVTGATVAAEAQRLWHGAAVPPLLTSFEPEALEAAREAAPSLPRGLLLEKLRRGWPDEALALGCIAVIGHHRQWTPATAAAARQAGLRTLAYTVNDPAEAGRLVALGLDGIITDRIDLFAPQAA